MLADVGHNLWLQQVVHVGVASFLVRCVDWHGNHVKPHRCAFFRDRVTDLHTILRFLCTVLGLQHITRETHHYADVAVGQVTGVLG
ncbi:hypothetical protein UB47_11115 [Pseudomonas sp. 5]|nr:hypothetical protein UB47_11115 [Pseudomonas sp. 5]